MLFIYNLIVVLADFILKIVALFSKKIKLFVEGRKSVFKILSNKIKYYDKTYLTIGYYTPQYKRYVYKHCLKYLYPELKKSEVWEEVKR